MFDYFTLLAKLTLLITYTSGFSKKPSLGGCIYRFVSYFIAPFLIIVIFEINQAQRSEWFDLFIFAMFIQCLCLLPCIKKLLQLLSDWLGHKDEFIINLLIPIAIFISVYCIELSEMKCTTTSITIIKPAIDGVTNFFPALKPVIDGVKDLCSELKLVIDDVTNFFPALKTLIDVVKDFFFNSQFVCKNFDSSSAGFAIIWGSLFILFVLWKWADYRIEKDLPENFGHNYIQRQLSHLQNFRPASGVSYQ